MHKLLRLLLWAIVSLTGVLAVMVPAMRRGEPVNALWLVVAGVCAFAVSYRFYSAWLAAKVLAFDDRRATPAVTQADGKDYVPTNKWVVFGHHFEATGGKLGGGVRNLTISPDEPPANPAPPTPPPRH